jgi:iron(III) transport system substrate-binding protein
MAVQWSVTTHPRSLAHPARPVVPAFVLLLALLAALAVAGCRQEGPREVVVYASLDEPYARPVLEEFTRSTGITVRPVYDTEANKSRGLAQRILAERTTPRADVFWSSEVMQMLLLQRENALTPYRSPALKGMAPRYRDSQYYWSGFAGRFRVLAYHTGDKKAGPAPQSLLDLTAPRYRGRVAMANPLFGTTMTEAAALFQMLGSQRAREYYRQRKANQTLIVDGNSVAAERTARGDVLVGQTDTDDAFIRTDQKRPLEVIFPDQQGFGTLLIPNTVAQVKGGPHPEMAQKLMDFLLRPETELMLAKLPSRQLPLHPGLEAQLPENVRPLTRIKQMDVDYPRLIDHYEDVDLFLRETFLK